MHKSNLRLADTAIMCVCNAVYADACSNLQFEQPLPIPIEIKSYTLKPEFSVRRFLGQGAAYVKHLSIELTVTYVARNPCIYRNDVKQILPEYLESIAASCPQPRHQDYV